MKWTEDRQRQIEQRFPPREHFSAEQLHSRFFADLPRDCVLDCLMTLEHESHLKIGFLRPDDSLAALFVPVRSLRPWRWLFYRGLEGDSQAALSRELYRRATARGRRLTRGDVRTFRDFVRMWCPP